MEQAGWSQAALVILGHGSTVNEESAAPVYLHASNLRRRNIFGEVREAFWKQEPQVKTVLATLTWPRVFIVPMFISEGYFSGQIIPNELGFGEPERNGVRILKVAEARTFYYCRAIGTHSQITDVVLSRAGSAVLDFPFPRAPEPAETTLFLAGHGTLHDTNSRLAVERQADVIRSKAQYAAVHAVFLEEEPRIERWHELAMTHNVVVVPFFISDGMHTQEDIPVLLGEPEPAVRRRIAGGQAPWRNPTEKRGKLVWLSSSVGCDPRVAEIVLERVREAADAASLPV